MITHVAIRWRGVTYELPKPYRHHHLIRVLHMLTGEAVDHKEQGFLSDTHQFLTRESAMIHAVDCGQIKRCELVHQNECLFSEDLW